MKSAVPVSENVETDSKNSPVVDESTVKAKFIANICVASCILILKGLRDSPCDGQDVRPNTNIICFLSAEGDAISALSVFESR